MYIKLTVEKKQEENKTIENREIWKGGGHKDKRENKKGPRRDKGKEKLPISISRGRPNTFIYL